VVGGDALTDIIDSVADTIDSVVGVLPDFLGTALLSGAMASIEQKDRPIQLIMLDNGFPSWMHWILPRPEDLSYTHPTRASAVNTLGGAYVDDFGTGIVEISLRGNTGYKMGMLQDITGAIGLDAGDVMLFNLRTAIVDSYHQKRLDYARAGQDPERVELLLVDTLNMALWVVYPRQFQLQRSRQRPLLYQYVLQMWGLKRLI